MKHTTGNKFVKGELELKLRSLYRAITSAVNNGSSIDTQNIVMFGNKEEGYLMLSGQGAVDYRETVQLAIKIVCSSPVVSRNHVEKKVQSSVLKVIDVNSIMGDLTYDQRVNYALEYLEKSFDCPPIKYQYIYPVYGLSPQELPFVFGNVEFFILNETVLNVLGLATKSDDRSKSDKRTEQIVQGLRIPDLYGSVYAKVLVSAIDPDAAEDIALRDLQNVIEVLNFFISFVSYSDGSFLFLPGEAGSGDVFHINKQEGLEYGKYGRKLIGSKTRISFRMILEANEEYALGFEKAGQLIAGGLNNFQIRLFSAMRWVGRANVSEALSRKDQAFLFYTIALESIILLDGNQGELQYRLRLRVAHLLGKTKESRSEISGYIKDLYKIRSSIVHNGKFDVVDSEISMLRYIVQNCLVRLLRDEPFSLMKEPRELVMWFDEKILG